MIANEAAASINRRIVMKVTLTALSLLLAATTWAQAPAPKSGAAGTQQQGGQTAEESFKNRDANKDNFLSKTEITGSRVADSFDKLDTNKDGKLSLAEYKIGRDAVQGQQGQGRAAQGQDGANRQQGQGQNVEARFKERDKNSDGFVSKAELEGSRMADRFAEMDTNKDGKLSLNEMKAGSQGMGQNMNKGAAPGSAKKTTT
jgi:Ca2+-binding EF-hand superfamily protein